MKSSDAKSRIMDLVGLYQKDPAAFEARRADLIRDMIEDFPEEYRRSAHGLQFQLEMRLRRYRDPVVRMNAMIGIFWEQFDKFNRVLNDPVGYLDEMQAKSKAAAKVLPLKPPKVRH